MSTIENMYDSIKLWFDDLEESEINDILTDVANHGADYGVPCFTYTLECVNFYEANEDLIYELLHETANEMGHSNIEELISTFGRSDMLSTPDQRKNLLAWFALEEVARYKTQ